MLRHALRSPAISLAFGSTLAACGDGGGPSQAAPCSGNVTVAVTAAPAPRFSWTPVCAAIQVQVTQGQQLVWSVTDPGQAGSLRPPMTYGILPAGASQGLAPGALQAGLAYTVTVFWLDPQVPPGIVTPAGSGGFTP
jgi:hypothetical protein